MYGLRYDKDMKNQRVGLFNGGGKKKIEFGSTRFKRYRVYVLLGFTIREFKLWIKVYNVPTSLCGKSLIFVGRLRLFERYSH